MRSYIQEFISRDILSGEKKKKRRERERSLGTQEGQMKSSEITISPIFSPTPIQPTKVSPQLMGSKNLTHIHRQQEG